MPPWLSPSFNPTLVRFNVRTPNNPMQPSRVSIPHWFDSTTGKDAEQKSRKTVQYHTGSNQRVRRLIKRRDEEAVSIPHWFDSTQRVFLVDRRDQQVSIPHWFDSTMARSAVSGISQWFQSHTGSIQRFTLNTIRSPVDKFQSHTGSIQRCVAIF